MLAALAVHLAATADETNGSRPLARRRRLRIDGPPDGNPAKMLPENNLARMRAMFRMGRNMSRLNISDGQRPYYHLRPELLKRVQTQVDEMDRLEHMKDRAMQDIVSDFIRQAHRLPAAACRAAPPVVYDVGSNSGGWLKQVIKRHEAVANLPRPCRLSVSIFEPQPAFAGMLSALAARQPNSRFYAAAVAATDGGNLTMYVSANDQTSSANKAMASRFGLRSTITVPRINLARKLRGEFAGAPQRPLLLKLDVESGEYDLLPSLLLSGSLCLPSHLLVEWHLNSLPPSRRLNGLSLRTTLVDLLKQGCPNGRPEIIAYESYPPNNKWGDVPGLTDMAMDHLVHEATDPVDATLGHNTQLKWQAVHTTAKKLPG
jgi:FkbM family methyltransferase